MAVRELARERVMGRFRDDIEGFTAELKSLQARYERGELGFADNNSGATELPIDTLQDIFDDRDRFREEIHLQLVMRIQDF